MNGAESISQQLLAETRENFNSRLIQEVKKYPILYERRNHRDVEGVRTSWQAIGASLNAPAKLCETRWTSLRQTYSRKCQEPFLADQESNRVKWQWYHEMEFVRPFILPRKRIRSFVPIYDNGEEEDGDYSDGAAFSVKEEPGDTIYHPANYTNGSCSVPLRLTASHMENSCTTPDTSLQDFQELSADKDSAHKHDYSECRNPSSHSCRGFDEGSEWDATGKLVATTLSRLHPKNARHLKIKILRLLCETEESEMANESQS